jgi:hypothetical protein
MSEHVEPKSSGFFEHIARPKVRAVLNVLLEAPFFYKQDDPDLFAFLRRNLAEFQRFYDELYGFRLVVDGRAARLYKPRWYNGALKPSQHDVFDLTRRDDCITFLLVLEFFEHLLDERNADIDDIEGLRFEFGELYAFARGRLGEVLGDAAIGDEDVRRLLRALMPTLLRYRFVREVPPSREEREGLEPDRLLYECLPALHHYDVRVLGRSALQDALRSEDPSLTTEPAEQQP